MKMTLEEAQEILKHYDPRLVYPPELEAGLEEAARIVKTKNQAQLRNDH